jgi:hypothetical protein
MQRKFWNITEESYNQLDTLFEIVNIHHINGSLYFDK